MAKRRSIFSISILGLGLLFCLAGALYAGSRRSLFPTANFVPFFLLAFGGCLFFGMSLFLRPKIRARLVLTAVSLAGTLIVRHDKDRLQGFVI